LLIHRRYLERLREQGKAQTRIAQELSDRLDAVRSEVEQALNRCRIIEQLKARSESLERDRNIRTVQKQLDEQNTTRFAGEIQSDSA
jgi:sensor domain CHASE-containing protein